MAIGLRVRVTWDGDVVQDTVFASGRVRVGGERAQVPLPTEERRLRFDPLALGGWRMVALPGARLEFPGEEPALVTDAFERTLGRGTTCGAALLDDERHTRVEFELVSLAREHDGLLLGLGLVGVAFVALFGAFGYQLVRHWGEGDHARWAEPELGAAQASVLRVAIGPDSAATSRLATGAGLDARGKTKSPPTTSQPRPKHEPKSPTPAIAHLPSPIEPAIAKPRPHRVARRRPTAPLPDNVLAARHPQPPIPQELIPSDENATPRDPNEEAANAHAPLPPADPRPATEESQRLVEQGQQAFLAAELRQSIDQLTTAAKQAPLDYDNTNWLGLAHYFLGEHEAAKVLWEQAIAMDPARPDARNNLGGIARRRGDLDGEIAQYLQALSLHPGDCHALDSLALARAKQGRFADAYTTIAESDVACGGGYAYTDIQRAGILALEGKRAEAMAALEQGLARVDTLLPIKEYEVESDLLLDPAFSSLRRSPRFDELTARYLPRAVQAKAQILQAAAAPAPSPPTTAARTELKDPFTQF